MNTAICTKVRRSLTAALTVMAVGGVLAPTEADAAVRVQRQKHVVKTKHRHEDRGRYVEPVFELRERVIIVPAVYENRERRVWREPVYEVREVRVERPAVVVTRPVARYVRGRIVGYREVREVIKPARVEVRTEQVLVREGHWDRVVERVCVRPEHKKIVTERVLVRDGYWMGKYVKRAHRDHHRHRDGVRVVVRGRR